MSVLNLGSINWRARSSHAPLKKRIIRLRQPIIKCWMHCKGQWKIKGTLILDNLIIAWEGLEWAHDWENHP